MSEKTVWFVVCVSLTRNETYLSMFFSYEEAEKFVEEKGFFLGYKIYEAEPVEAMKQKGGGDE